MARLAAAVIPVLRAKDLGETIAFYTRLGFAVTGRHEDDGQLVWCELTRDLAKLHFHVLDHPDLPSRPLLSGVLYFRPDDVAALAEEWHGVVELHWGPEVTEYGWREFAFRDPNGYLIAFSEDAVA